MGLVRFTTVTLEPLGVAYVGYTDRGICYLSTTVEDDGAFAAEVQRRYGCGTGRDDGAQPRWQEALTSWLAGVSAEIPLDLSRVTPFQRSVMLKTMQIPRGSARSYQWVAEAVGNPRASRAVGSVMRNNPIPLLVPCHRVVAASGKIGNYSMGGPTMKRRLLEIEGVESTSLK